LSDPNDVTAVSSETGDHRAPSGRLKNERLLPLILTFGIILSGLLLTSIFRQEISAVGVHIMTRYGQNWLDGVLFLITAISCTPLVLPVWCYALVGVALGYDVIRLASVMALGATLGSFTTYALGRYFGNHPWTRNRFPNLHNHPWSHGRSVLYIAVILFLGTASPIPCDIFYAACGAKRYSAVLFILATLAGRFVRYLYLGYGFDYFSSYI
jgi:membrane protein YqaA with SNARE-associated domain